jgi:hypothetical protein
MRTRLPATKPEAMFASGFFGAKDSVGTSKWAFQKRFAAGLEGKKQCE